MTNIKKMELLNNKKNVIEDLLKDKFENETEKQKTIIQALEILINFIAELKSSK